MAQRQQMMQQQQQGGYAPGGMYAQPMCAFAHQPDVLMRQTGGRRWLVRLRIPWTC